MATAGDRRGPGPERAFASPLPPSGTVRLSKEEGHHLVRVRRARAGDEVVLFDGEGGSRLGRLEDASADGATVLVLGPYPDREPSRRVAVAVALPGAGRADDLVASLAECGVTALVPLRAERATADPAELLERRRARWERQAREAAKVNGRSRLMRIEAPVALASVAAWARAALPPWTPVLLDPDPSLPSLPAALAGAPAPLLLVGPEGGFTEAEVEALRGAGVPSARLWACALRTEAAAIAGAAVALSL